MPSGNGTLEFPNGKKYKGGWLRGKVRREVIVFLKWPRERRLRTLYKANTFLLTWFGF